MAKKPINKSTGKNKSRGGPTETESNALPQNIVPIGERVLESKNIYISQPVYKAIHKFTMNKTVNESGGLLVGYTVEEFGKNNIIIDGFIEAKYTEATPSTLTFTQETWVACHKELAKRHEGKKIVGWIHTHPNFGVFLSEYDRFIHDNFFNDDSQIAYVIDPIQKEEGFYFWIDKKLEKCAGFYIFDKTGKKIDKREEKEAEDEAEAEDNSVLLDFRDFVIAGLIIAVFVLTFVLINMGISIVRLDASRKEIINSIYYLAKEVDNLEIKLLELQKENEKDSESAGADKGVVMDE